MLIAVGVVKTSNDYSLVILEGSMHPTVSRLLKRSTPLPLSHALFLRSP